MEKQLCEEKKARQNAEERMTQAMLESTKEMSRLRLSLEMAREEKQEIQRIREGQKRKGGRNKRGDQKSQRETEPPQK